MSASNVNPASLKQSQRAGSKISPAEPPRVLIVEDSATQRELLGHILQAHGYAVITAGNGAQAFELVLRTRPTLVISDILMPEMDGYELCRRIKADQRLRSTPVVLLTALSDPKDVIEGLESGADNFIVKPYEEDYLLGRLEWVLSNRDFAAREDEHGVEIVFAGHRYFIESRRRQILDLLLSTYEAAVRKNDELERAREALKLANRELEQRVRDRTAKLEAVNQSLESFCYSIAHDLRSPLRAIQGYTSVILDQYSAVYDEEARENSKRVMAAARQMDQLIRDLLAYGQVTAAELPLSRLSLEARLDAVINDLRHEIRQRQAEIEVQRPLPEVKANSMVLEQVLTNLLSNALKFSKDDIPPKVRIWSALQPNGLVRLYIQDNGIGIDPAYSERIFGLFQRLHNTSKYPGTGVGLVIVRKGIERMGGHAGVESRPGEGAQFWIELPRPKN